MCVCGGVVVLRMWCTVVRVVVCVRPPAAVFVIFLYKYRFSLFSPRPFQVSSPAGNHVYRPSGAFGGAPVFARLSGRQSGSRMLGRTKPCLFQTCFLTSCLF